jgi:hypothetical protein
MQMKTTGMCCNPDGCHIDAATQIQNVLKEKQQAQRCTKVIQKRKATMF